MEESFSSASSEVMEFTPCIIDWNAVRVFAEKNLRIAMRYPANILAWAFLPLMWFAPYLLMMTAIGGSASMHFTEISGFEDFIAFAVIGWFVYTYVDTTIWSIGQNFRWEQFSGTLEPLFVAPVPRTSILIGAAISDTVSTSMSALIMLGTSCVIFGVGYALTTIGPIILILMMMVVALFGFGFMIAGLIIVFKDPSVLTELIDNVVFALSPVSYPIQVLPRAAQMVAYALPATIAIMTIRELAIGGALETVSFLYTLGGLALLIVAFWIMGLLCFRYAERWTKKRGSMGGF